MMNGNPLDQELVREFIFAAHGDFAKVQVLYEQEPALLHAVMNWDAGDWESGLGAAAHTGRRDIALFLLARGARMDIFTAAMLGNLAIVQAMIEAQPEALTATGAHGIPLLHHARMGGEQAQPVFNYLQTKMTEEATA